ncbi:cation channel family protein (macronuclear) [Tetrahymena thermophila SB210]|uniref:Cation channel family protein n=1 Tax=Tetrahymena thermophila (strain SB210) TaxID=312017 RepID=W7XIV2_TETTS|nr:cation channel family protein [Tetrahymena thermophila SB210]EWS74946.1 cation channel family protein [Tetrahymena thermophila SB210]|eukprot:XP_012652535.1 cation channel family protein [Tetrahymena thermophila SB210]
MIENSILNDSATMNTHMNSIQFNEQVFTYEILRFKFKSYKLLTNKIQDHLDLQILNQKQCETVKEYTHDEINTGDIVQILADSFNNPSNVQTDFKFLEYIRKQPQRSMNYQFTQEKQKYQQNLMNKDEMMLKLKNTNQNEQNQEQIQSKTSSQSIQSEEVIERDEKKQNKLMKSISLLVNVKSFYRLLTKNTRILGKLNKEQHYLINDISSVFQKNQQSKMQKFNKCLSKLKKPIQLINNQIKNIADCIPMFQPYNLYKFLWDILQAILILTVMFLFSLVVFFQMDIQNYVPFFQNIFIIFVLDILFTFNTGLVEKGNVIFDRKKVAITYLKKYFIMDQIALLPLFLFYLDIQLEGLYSWIVYFLILMKLFVLSDTFTRLTYYLSYQKNMENIVDLVKLVFIIACVCHIFCLFWHGIAIYEINQGSNTTWLQYRGIQDADIFTRYVQSFYYLAVTMITVGYGDITPQTTYEILFTTITMFVTGFFYAFSLNRIGNIIENIEAKDKSYKESMQVIHRLMREENVSQTLRVQVSNYLQYLYKDSNELEKQHEIEITNKLSKQLKYDLTQNIQGKYLKDIEFIDKLESKSKIVEIMEECLFSPGEYIFKQGDLDDCSLYYIVKGSVKIIYEYQSRDQTESLIITQLKKQQYFGDMQFIQGNSRILTAQASEFCRTYKIPREQFFKCIKQSDQDFENFQMLKEAYIFKENQKLFNIKCYICNKSDHISIKCPKTHLTLSKQTLIQKENKSTPHFQRETFQRKQNKLNSLFKNLEVLYGVYQFTDNEENFQDLEILENEMHLSQDEAFLEQQLLELQKQDNCEQPKQQQQNYQFTNQTISEEESDSVTNDKNQEWKYYNSMNQKNQSSIEIQSYQAIINQQDTILDENTQIQQNHNNSHSRRDYVLNQLSKTKQLNMSLQKIQSSNSLRDQTKQQDYSSNEERQQTTEKKSNQSIVSSKHLNI